jgi:hypothetical protein
MTTTDRVTPQPNWRFALLVVVVSFVVAVAVRWLIAGITVYSDERAMVVSAFALVIGFMVAVGGVGLGMRNRDRGGLFTLVSGLVLAAIHVVSGLNQGMSILRVPFDPSSTDFSAFLLVPLVYTIPAAILRLIRWWWVAVVLLAGIAVSNVALVLSAMA